MISGLLQEIESSSDENDLLTDAVSSFTTKSLKKTLTGVSFLGTFNACVN